MTAKTIKLEKKEEEKNIPKTPRIKLTLNQSKVIKEKYLKDSPSVEHWLYNVARNIALADILYLKEVTLEKVLEGVIYDIREYDIGNGEFVRMLLLHQRCKNFEEQDKNFKRFIYNLERLSKEDEKVKKIVDSTAESFYTMMAQFEFLPNSPTLMNAGRELQQLSACYVLPIEDSIESWGDVVKQTMLIHKSGGGTGFSAARVRPKGDVVKTTKGVASGAISPFVIINHSTEEIKQGGTRRGANMGILPYHHPDILDFISIKSESGKLDNFNISVALDSYFMECVEHDREFDLINPRTGEAVGKLNARELFDKITYFAWKTGDPGVIFLDRINESFSNPLPSIGKIEATNPCGEQPLLPYEACNLGSINLVKFVNDGEIDWNKLKKVVGLAVHFLDNVIDVNNYPIDKIEFMSKGSRRIGLGVMGLAETLVKIGIPYDSEEAVQKSEEIMRFINESALEASCKLAETRGVFPFFKDSIYDETSHYHKEWARGRPRNSARTTIAPTGTISIAAGLQGSGIEPFFAIAYVRYTAQALDAIKNGIKPDEKDVFYEVNPLFRDIAYENHFFGYSEQELWKLIVENHGSVRGIDKIPEAIQKLFPVAHDVPLEYHVRHQAAFQKYTDNAVSKTINLPNNASVEDVKKAYLLAYKLNCKGITVYRDGSKAQQVLNVASTRKVRNLSAGVSSVYYKFETGYGPIHIHIDHEDGKPFRVFTNITPIGTEVAGLTSVLGIMISKYLELGGDVSEIIKHLNSVKGDKPYGFGANRIESLPHSISIALKKFLENYSTKDSLKKGEVKKNVSNNKLSETTIMKQNEKTKLDNQVYCPACFSPNVSYESGCRGVTCHDCGYSECS